MIMFSYAQPQRHQRQRTATRFALKQASALLLTFLLCLSVGSVLLLLARPMVCQTTASCVWVFPLIFGWWAVVLPMVCYWLFQHAVLCWQALASPHAPVYFSPVTQQHTQKKGASVWTSLNGWVGVAFSSPSSC